MAKDPQRSREAKKAWRAANPDKVREINRRYWQSAKGKAARQRRYNRCKAQFAIIRKKRYARDKDAELQRNKEWVAANLERRREIAREAARRRRAVQRLAQMGDW
jgi:hypothetical protein